MTSLNEAGCIEGIAKALSLDMPATLLARADEVAE
jgi:hypothetical protein